MTKYQPIIGLEIHIELKTKSKMFCGCSAVYFGHKANTHCCPVCLGLPGALPVPNEKAIEWVIWTGLALGCQMANFSKFDRKNYFYPDLPKGYQISQYDLPLAKNGKLKINNGKTIMIRRVHLEEDTAKMIHHPGEKFSLIDFNRSGVPLMEIVTEPDIESAAQAKEFLKKLQQIVRYLDISDCDMEKGSMRLEVNISVSRTAKLPNYKIEVKNLNSFRFVEKAIEYEIARQAKILKEGKTPIQETRGWDEKKQVTYTQRIKEEAQDYRYFPEPDIPPLKITNKQITNYKLQIARIELPDKKASRFIKDYGLSEDYTGILTASKVLADYYEEAVMIGKKYKISAIKIANRIINKKINLSQTSAVSLIKTLGQQAQKPVMSQEESEKIIDQILRQNQAAVNDFKKGKTVVIGFLIGLVMAKSNGRVDPNLTKIIILKKLKNG